MSSSAKLIFGGLFSGIGQGVTSYGGMMRDAKMSALKRERKEADRSADIELAADIRKEQRGFKLADVESANIEAEKRIRLSDVLATGRATTATDIAKETAKETASARLEEQKRQSYLRARGPLRKAFDKLIEENYGDDAKIKSLEQEFATRDDALLKRVNSLYDIEEVKAADKEIEAVFGGEKPAGAEKPKLPDLPDEKSVESEESVNAITSVIELLKKNRGRVVDANIGPMLAAAIREQGGALTKTEPEFLEAVEQLKKENKRLKAGYDLEKIPKKSKVVSGLPSAIKSFGFPNKTPDTSGNTGSKRNDGIPIITAEAEFNKLSVGSKFREKSNGTIFIKR